VFIAATHENGKPMLTVQLSDNLVKDGMNASAMVREAAKLIKGGGGGQPHFAQAGGKDMDGLSAAMEKMRELLNH
jgi:alanyl-tRNA synthetase